MYTPFRRKRFFPLVALLGAFSLITGFPAAAQTLSGEALVRALADGGYNIYFRHAATDWGNNDNVSQAGDWKSCDPDRMRQLSDAGRDTAKRIGDAMRALGVPVGAVISSEYCRAAETARLLGFGEPRMTTDIMNMRAASFVGGRAAVVERAQRVLATPPAPGVNRVIVGHGNLMRAATGAYPSEGGSGIFRPDAGDNRGFVIVAELAAEDWMRLANALHPEAQ
jgi:broad specificity phosphatase PhoE